VIPRPLLRASFAAVALSLALAACGAAAPPAATVGDDRPEILHGFPNVAGDRCAFLDGRLAGRVDSTNRIVYRRN